MKTRILHTKIYSDNFFMELYPLEKFLFIYYITNENVNIIHCYECPNRKVQYDTGIDLAKILAFQEKVERAGKILFKDGYVLLINANKYEKYVGDSNEKAKESLISQLSEPIRQWCDRGVTGVYTPTINHNTEIISHKSKDIYISEDKKNQLVEKYKVPMAFVESKLDDLKNYCARTGKKYKDYEAALDNFIKTDAMKIKTQKGGVLDARDII